MIVDFHTHIFPPDVDRQRERLLAQEPTFHELYADPKATLATAEDLLASMTAGRIDVSVALGFAWNDIDACHRHNDYLIETGRNSGGHIVPFCTLPLAAGMAAIEAEAQRCIEAGVRGFGELRPENLGFDLTGKDGDWLAGLAQELDALLLFHVTEPVGHAYPGKHGLSLSAFDQFVRKHPKRR